jgi:hypothetical protein
MMKAVIDRFEGDLAVLILADDDQRLNVPANCFPQRPKKAPGSS